MKALTERLLRVRLSMSRWDNFGLDLLCLHEDSNPGHPVRPHMIFRPKRFHLPCYQRVEIGFLDQGSLLEEAVWV